MKQNDPLPLQRFTLFQVLLFVIGLIMAVVGIVLLPAVNGIVLTALGGTIAAVFLCILCCRVGCF